MIIKTRLESPKSTTALGRSSFIGLAGGHAYFLCNCGNDFKLRETNKFLTDLQFACSTCKRHENLAPFIGERYVFKRIRSDAKSGGREFNIGFDWFVETCHEPCHYCGESNGNSTTVPSRVTGEVLLKDFRYNGLDRIDNKIGYEKDNCVPCCIICNRAKNSLPYGVFVAWIANVVKYNKS